MYRKAKERAYNPLLNRWRSPEREHAQRDEEAAAVVERQRAAAEEARKRKTSTYEGAWIDKTNQPYVFKEEAVLNAKRKKPAGAPEWYGGGKGYGGGARRGSRVSDGTLRSNRTNSISGTPRSSPRDAPNLYARKKRNPILHRYAPGDPDLQTRHWWEKGTRQPSTFASGRTADDHLTSADGPAWMVNPDARERLVDRSGEDGQWTAPVPDNQKAPRACRVTYASGRVASDDAVSNETPAWFQQIRGVTVVPKKKGEHGVGVRQVQRSSRRGRDGREQERFYEGVWMDKANKPYVYPKIRQALLYESGRVADASVTSVQAPVWMGGGVHGKNRLASKKARGERSSLWERMTQDLDRSRREARAAKRAATGAPPAGTFRNIITGRREPVVAGATPSARRHANTRSSPELHLNTGIAAAMRDGRPPLPPGPLSARSYGTQTESGRGEPQQPQQQGTGRSGYAASTASSRVSRVSHAGYKGGEAGYGTVVSPRVALASPRGARSMAARNALRNAGQRNLIG